MAMKESVRSMAAYFILVALIGAYANIRAILRSPNELFVIIPCAISALWALMFLYMGIRLRKLLVTSYSFLKIVLLISLGLLVIRFLLSLAVQAPMGLVTAVVGVLIILYLLANVKRLAKEEQAKFTSSLPPTPAAQASPTETPKN